MFHELYFKLKKDQPMPVLCTLASNIVTHFEVSSTAALAKCFSPLKIFEVKGPKDFSTIIQLDRSQHIVHNQSEIICWLQEAKGNSRYRVSGYGKDFVQNYLFKRNHLDLTIEIFLTSYDIPFP